MKYLATIAYRPSDSDNLMPQSFFNVFIDADNEEEAEKLAYSKGYALVSIREVDSSLASTMLYIDREMDEAKKCIKQGISEEYFRARLRTLKDVMLIAQGGV